MGQRREAQMDNSELLVQPARDKQVDMLRLAVHSCLEPHENLNVCGCTDYDRRCQAHEISKLGYNMKVICMYVCFCLFNYPIYLYNSCMLYTTVFFQ